MPSNHGRIFSLSALWQVAKAAEEKRLADEAAAAAAAAAAPAPTPGGKRK
jgi:hypothetical protein